METLTFNEKTHEYFLGSKKLVSVTQLLAKHGLAPNYEGVNAEVLEAKAKRGSVIHKELEDYAKLGKVGFTEELEQFIKYATENKIQVLQAEWRVCNDLVAGTYDCSGLVGDESFIGDYKTTSTLHKESVAWQLSLYAYLEQREYKHLLAFHFNNGLKVVELEPIPTAEIERLLECERNGEIYKKQELQCDATEKLVAIQQTLDNIAKQKEELEAQQNALKEKLMTEMKKNNIKSIDNDFFKITYVDESERVSVDSKKLKEEMPEIYEKYKKTVKVKSGLRITIKK